MAGGVTAEVPTIKAIVKLLVINFIIKLYALKNNFENKVVVGFKHEKYVDTRGN